MARVACATISGAVIAIVAALACLAGSGQAAAPRGCPVHVAGKRLVDHRGQTVYRYPDYRVESAQIKCSGRTVWVLFHGGGEASQEAYLGVRSGNAGRTWKRLLAEAYFGIKAPFTIDSYSGPWTIAGEKRAYFVGSCPACGRGTVSLTVTRDGGRHFRHYAIPELSGFRGTAIQVAGADVKITGKSQLRTGQRNRTVTLHMA
ncbi:MAG: hypothetical protein ACJ76O_10465 [Gaiellaceae bacterium]